MRIGKNKMASVAAALILALPAAKGEDTMKAKEFEIKGPWQVAVDGVVFQVPPPATIEVTGERHDRLPLFQNAGGWNDGVPLKGVWAVGCSLADALDPASVAAALSDGTALERGKDYQFNDKWGTIGRVEGGRVGEETPVTVRYRYIPMRLDSLAEGGDGSWRYVVGEPASWCPLPPELCPGETRRANL